MYCKRCGKPDLVSWSMFRQNANNNGYIAAFTVALLKGIKHATMGELSVGLSKIYDKRSKSIYRCGNCHLYYFQCPFCNELIEINMNEMVLDKTTVFCENCRKITLYADEDYNSGGG